MAGTAGAAGAAWLLLQTAFTDVLAKGDWLKLWDHLLTNPPSFIYYAAAAYLVRDQPTAIRDGRDFGSSCGTTCSPTRPPSSTTPPPRT
jgi:hypothetical protein